MTFITPSLEHALANVDGLGIRRAEPMAGHTTYRVGGPAALWIQVSTLASLTRTLQTLAQEQVPFIVLGNGSNTLFADAGFAGAVLRLVGEFSRWELRHDAFGQDRHCLEVGAGLSISRLLRVTKEHDLGGLECLGGVPGTVGGAVVMNAGTALGEVKDALQSVQIVLAGKAPRWLDASELRMSYRHTELPAGAIVTAARFLTHGSDPEMRARLESVLAYRKATQPLQSPSCGSVFANPAGDFAGRLIEDCGLKGRRIGGAQVSEKHANWIVNDSEASAADVRGLIELCAAEVAARHGVTLRHEVRFLGDWEGSS